MTRRLRPSLPPTLAVLAVCDFLLLSACFTASAHWTQLFSIDVFLLYQGGLQQIVVVALSIQVILYLERMYERFVSWSFVFRQMCLALGAAFLLQALLASIHTAIGLPRWTMIWGASIALIVFPLWRLAAAAVLGKAVPSRKVLFLGGPSQAVELALRFREQPELGMEAVGYLGQQAAVDLPRLGSIPEFSALVNEYAPQQIVIARRVRGLPIRRLLELQKGGTRVERLGDLYEAVTGRISLSELPSEVEPRPGYVVARDIYSVLIAGILLVPAALVMAAIAAATRGPAFIREPRIGLNRRVILLCRFRHENLWPWLSALPSLLNVLRGELSLIGPAPLRPEFVQVLLEKIPSYKLRFSVTPGLTGWAQVHQDKGVPDAVAALEHDLYYIKHVSPFLDAYITVLALRPG